jgi:hypothetical protein
VRSRIGRPSAGSRHFVQARLSARPTSLSQKIEAIEGVVPVSFRKSYPDVLIMQSGQDGNGDNDARPLDCSMQGRVFL